MEEQYFPNKKRQSYYANQRTDAGVRRRAGGQRLDTDKPYAVTDREATTDSPGSEMVAQSRRIHISVKKQASNKSVRTRSRCKRGGRYSGAIQSEEVS